ncbi:Ig-like domain-containing protein [Planctomycetes bacterium K23_9]|uniref:Ig domain protein n=1 Tax=Stieleria marina TaxID=1930275 RepID=A0A517NVR5_9BACT|nr:Putative Ig domain protein [Planctomycetes bacterium K23_9]
MSNQPNQKLHRIMEQLEDRVLFDAVPDGGFLFQPDGMENPVDAARDLPAQEMSTQTTVAADQQTYPRELILVDANVDNADAMIAEIMQQRQDRTVEVRLLDVDTDGIDQISEILKSSGQSYDAIHVLSHGSEGSLSLGSSTLNAGSLPGYAGQFVGWADSLTTDADILFYGCDLAGDSAGQAFVESLAELTGADVAASDDRTGNAELGGDWDLEVATGSIEAETLTFEQWFGFLADFTPGVLTGVDIGPGSDTTSPTNWTHATGTGTINNLVNENGINSGYSLRITTTGSLTNEDNDPTAGTIPNHSNDLTGIDGSLYDNSGGTEQVQLRWSGLTAGQEYAVYSFSHASFNSLQTVAITGGNGTVTHADKYFGADDVLVNGSIGNSTTDLEDFATVMTADANGRITITITSQYWAVTSGTAISELSGLLPDATADVALVIEDDASNPITGNVLDNDSTLIGNLSVSEVNGNASNVGVTITGNHGTLQLDQNGDYTYILDNSDAAVQSLNELDNVVYIGSHDGSGTASSSSGQIEAVNLTTGATTVVTSSPLVPYINGLAANADNNLAYYSDDTNLYYWDVAANTHHTIGTLVSLGIPSGEGMLSGGGTYFDGSLFIGTEPVGGGPMVDVYELELSTDGKLVATTTALNIDAAAAAAGFPDVGGFGDLIYSNGAIYGSTTVAGYWRFDMTSGVFEQLNSEYRGQLMATEDGRIFSVTGNVVQQVDLESGDLTGATFNTVLEATDGSGAISGAHNPSTVLTESFTYTVVDDDGDEVTTTLTITIQGDNDPPQASDYETTVVAGSTNNPISITTPTDVDNSSAELTITFDSVPPSSQGTYTVGVGGPVVTTSTTLTADQLNQLVFTPNSGFVGNVSDLDYTVTDPRGLSDSGTISIFVNAPPTATNNSGSVTEDTDLTETGNVITDNDGNGVDSDPNGSTVNVVAVDGATGSVASSVAGSYGSVQINANGSYTYTLNNTLAAVNALGPGDSLTDTFTYTIDDGTGLTDTATLTITIDGTNDAPTVTSTIPNQSDADAETGISVNAATYFGDPESGTLTFSATNLPPGLSINSSGLITGTVDPSASTGGPYSVTITAEDAYGSTVSQTITWAISNPPPTATDNDLGTTENTSISGNIVTDSDGNGVDSDPDGDTLTVTLINGVAGNVGGPVTGSGGGAFTVSSTGAYTLNPGTDFDYLAAGETAATTINYTISDGEGGTDTATVTVTVTGVNDSPTAFGTIPPQSGVDGTTLSTFDLSSFFGDPDLTDTLTYSAGGSLPPGLAINPTTGVVTGSYDPSASTGGPYSVVITAEDPDGATVVQAFTWTVTNPGPTATDNDLGTAEGSTLTGNVMSDADGHGVDSDVDGDTIVVNAVNGVAGNVASSVAGSNGGTFTIAANGSYTFATGSDFEYLDAGETATTTVNYTITDNEGGTDSATVTVVVTGTNDTPTANGTIPPQSGVDSTVESPLDVSGFFADVDATDTLTFSDGGTLPGGLSIHPTTGVITGTYDADSSQGGPYAVVITATDDNGATVTQEFTWTVTNPGPTATDNDLGTSEGSTLTGNVMSDADGHGVDSDVDGDTIVVNAVNGVAGNVASSVAGTNGGTFTIAANGSYTFATGSDFEYLDAGETATTTVDYTITDNEGGTDSATVTVVVTGTNDTPTANGTIPPQSGVDSTVESPLDVSGFFADVDATDTLTFSDGGTLPGGLSIHPTTGLITGTYDADSSQGGPYTVVITATDDNGATVTQEFAWTVTNPGPTATDNDLGTSEGSTLTGNVMSDADGHGVDSDVDGDTIVVNAVNGVAGNVASSVAGSNGGTFTIAANGSYTFATGSDFEYLDAGETATTTVDYTITDNEGGTDSATVTIVVTGTNDTPTANGTIPPQSGVDSTVESPLDVSGYFGDVDASDTLTFSDGGTLPGGLSINPTTGVITGTYDADSSQGGPYAVVITATDDNGATVTQEFTWTVTNPGPTATDNDLGTSEGSTLTGNVMSDADGHGVDSDVDGDAIEVSAVNGVAGNVASGVAGTNGGTFTIAANGSYTFATGSDFEYLDAGETATTTVDYTITDNEGGTDSATVTVVVTGTNDTPTANGTIPPQSGVDSTVESPLDVSGYFGDVDASDTLTFSDGGTLPGGLSINPTTGVITGTYDADSSQGGPYAVVITATDDNGATVTQEFTWTVTNPGPTATDNDLGTSEGSTLTGNVMSDADGHGVDSDVDGDTIVVNAVNGVAGNVASGVAGSNGGTFTIAANGSYTFATGSDFEYLDAGETATTTVDYTITDNEGGTDSATVTVIVTGTNDTPTANGTIPPQTGVDSTVESPLDVSGFFADVDATDTLTFSDGGTLPGGLSINPTTGVITGTYDADSSQGGPYAVVITATDDNGATVTQEFTWTVTNPGPTATDNDLGTSEGSTLTGNVMSDADGHGVDSDVDGDTIVVNAVNGVAGNVASSVAGTNGGTFTIAANGSYTFATGSDFEYLDAGETATTTVDYTITDNEGGTDSATVTVVVTGTNDTPTANGTIPPQSGVDSTVESPLDVSGFFADVDATDTLTFSDGGTLPGGLSIHPTTGLITGTYDADSSQGGPYTVVITATDDNGATVTQEFAWTVTNPGPTATDNDLGTSEGSTLTGNVMSDADGHGVDSDVDGDTIVVNAVNGVAGNVASSVAGSNGGTFTIAANGSYTFATGSDFEYLDAGETATTTVDYTITDNEGGTDSATVTIVVTGTNDTPTANGTIPPQSGVDSTVESPLDVSGYFGDVDASDTLTFSDGGTLPGGLSINPTTGVITGTYDADSSQGGPYAVVITATDDNGATVTQEFTWTVTNPGPTATDNDLGTSEGSTLTGNVMSDADGHGVDSDVDGDAIEVSAVNGVAGNVASGVAGTNGGTFTIAANGSYTFATGSDFEYLDAGETATTTVDYTITDNEGGTDSATVTVVVTGTNDTPTANGTIPPQSGVDSTVESPLDVSGYFGDVDASDTLTFSDGGTLPGGLSINPTTGVITGTYDADSSQGGPYAVVITATDDNGATVTQEFTWTVTNPGPTATDNDLGTSEGSTLTGNVMSDADGHGVDSDVDGDTIVVNAVNGVAGNVASGVAGSNGGTFTIAANGSYTFATGSDFEYLDAGETATTTVDYTITDNEGGTDSATVTVIVTGTNDTPTANGTIPPQTGVDSTVESPLDVSGFFADVDATDTLTFSDGGTLPGGLSINPTTGVITGTYDADSSQGGPYAVVITATDDNGATVTQEFTWTVTNPGPTATDNDLGTSEGSTLTGNVMSDADGHGVDSDVDVDTIVVSAVNGTAGNVASGVAGSNGGTFTIAADGSYTFATGSDFEYLDAGETATTTVDYTITDNEGGTDSATVTVVVTGTNDAPTANGTIPPQSGVDSTVESPLDVSGFFADVDATDTLTFSDGVTLPGGLSINPTTGVITGTYDADSSQGGPYAVVITATDDNGATVTQEFTWTVTNPGPTATDNDLGTAEGSTLTGNVMSDADGHGVDSDVDGDTIVVSAVNGVAGNVASGVAGSNGGTFTIAADGSYTFATGSDFDDLGFGQTRTTTVAYTISDGEGGTDSATVTVVVSGANQAPTASGTIPPQTGVDSTVIAPLDVSGYFSDGDSGDVLTFSTGSTLPGGLSIDSATGVITGTYDADASQTSPYSVTVTATDVAGATATRTFTWTVTNPGPDATDNDLGTSEGSTLTGNVMTDSDGHGVDSDIDGDTITVSEVNGVAANVATAVAGSNGGNFTINADGGYTFATGSDFEYLAAGETATTTVTHTITDDEGGTDTATVSVLVTGTNDTPTAIGTIPPQTGVDSTVAAPLDLSGYFGDVDASNTLTFTDGGTLPEGLSINSAGVVTGTYDADSSQSGPYAVVITATDDAGTTVSQSFTWTVTNPGPDATDNARSTSQGSTISGNVMSDSDGSGVDSDIDGDTITVVAINGTAGDVAQGVAGSTGGTFTILSDGSYSFATGADFDYLAAGETATTTVNYTISDNEGGSDTATVTVTVTGTNDTPTAVGTIPPQAGVDSTVVAPLDLSGYFADTDTSNTLTFSTGTTLPGGLSIHPTTGVVTGTYDADASQGGPYVVVVTATDNGGATVTQSFTWTVTNPGPDATDNLLGTTESSTLTGNVMTDNDGSGVDSDVDGDTLTVTEVNGAAANVNSTVAGSAGGTFTIDSAGAYTFDTLGDFDYLAAGETATTTVTYTISDGEGGTDTATVSVVVTGVNNTPTATGTIPPQAGVDSTALSLLDLSGYFDDVDTSNTLSFSDGGTLPGGLSIDSTTGVVTGTYDADASQSGPYTVVITATDDDSATVTQTFVWSVTNPGPDATDNDLGTTENAALSGNVMTDNDGNGVDSDIDGDTITVVAINGTAGDVGAAIAGSGGGSFTIDSTGAYTFAPGSDFDSLNAGQTATTTIQYTISDNEGGSDTATVTVVVTGTNDAPTAEGTIPPQLGVDSTVVSPLDLTGYFGDVDNGSTLAFTAGSTLPPGLAIDSTTGIVTGTYDASASVGGPYTVTITATDDQGATVTQSFVWTVTNPGPDAIDNSQTTDQNTAATGNVLTDVDVLGVDNDVDGDTLVVSQISGSSALVGASVAGSAGGTFTVDAAGAYTFTPGGDFDWLGTGETATTTVAYTITDNEGGTDTAVLTITLTGTNETPTAIGTIPPQSGVDSTVVAPLDLSGYFGDVDATNTLTFSAGSTLPAGLSIDSATGVVTGTYDSDSSQSGPYNVVITATDNDGASTTQSFTWTVTNPGPVAQNDDFTTTQDSTISGNLIAVDNGSGVDSDIDGDTITVLDVNGATGNVGSAVVGSAGGTFTVASNGSYSFATGNDFDDLANGETRDTQIAYTITDSEGGTSTATVTVTVTGVNDDPFTIGTIPPQSDTDSVTITPVDVSGYFGDTDTTDVFAFDDGGTLPPGLSIDTATGIISGTPTADASDSGPYTVTITADDGNGGSITQTFNWDVVNPGPVATDDGFATNQDATISGNVMTVDNGGGVDSDVDGDAITVTAVGGVAGNVASSVNGSDGGTFTIHSDGSYSFNTGNDFDDLAVGQTRDTTVTYTISDGDLTSTATVTVNVTGTNDGPDATGTIPDQSDVDSDTITPVDVSGYFVDVDRIDTLTFSDNGTLPSGLSVGLTTGIITGTLSADASQGGPYNVTITAMDDHGEVIDQTFTWQVSNPIPTATDNDATIQEGLSHTANVITDDEGSGVDNDPDGDALTVSHVGAVAGNVGNSVSGSNGGTFTIASDGSYTFDTASDFGYLNIGESALTSVTYTVTDNEGGSATATVTITVTGASGAPASVGTIPPQSGVDSTTETPLDLSVYFADPDASDVLSFDDNGTLPYGLSIDPVSGIVTGTYDSSASANGPYTVTITATDLTGQQAQQTFNWTVTNPLPIATDNTVSTTENASRSGNVITDDNGSGVDSDPDGDVLSVDAVNGLAANVGAPIAGSSGGTFTVSPNGSYAFLPGTDFDSLAAGEVVSTSVTYTIIDAEGGTSTATLTVNVTGTNDVPTTNGTIPPQVGVDSTTIAPLDLSGYFDDVDGALVFKGTALPEGLSIDSVSGVVTGTYDADASQSGPYSVVITATDSEGVAVNQTFTWNVNNPGPDATDNDRATSQDAAIGGNVIADADGHGVDTDIDGDVIIVNEVNGTGANVGANVDGTNGGVFVLASDGSYSFDPQGDFDSLAAGESATTSVSYTITDNEGGTDTATLTVTVNGTNQTPTATGMIPPQSSTDDVVISPLDISVFFDDVDTTDVLTFADGGSLPPGLSLNSSSGVITGTLDNSASVGSPYTVAITVEDGQGGTLTRTFTWEVVNPGPVATDDEFTTDQDTAITGQVVTVSNGNSIDSDVDGDDLTVTAVNGLAANVASPIAGNNGGSFTIDSAGVVAFNPLSDFVSLTVGESATTSVTYTISDGEGGSDTATVTVTVNGTNDAPVILTTIAPQAHVDGQNIAPVDVSGSFADPDASDTLTFTAINLPSGLTIHPTTGVISGVIDNSASMSGPYAVTVTAADGKGGSVSQSFAWDVTNPNPTAQNNTNTVSDSGPTQASGNVIANQDVAGQTDNDPDGDDLVVTQIDGMSVNPNATISAFYGVLTIDSTGQYSYDLDVSHSSVVALAEGDTLSESFTYRVSDGEGGTDTAVLTITVVGSNDAPTTVGTIPDRQGVDANTIPTIPLAGYFTDSDSGDVLTFSDGGTLPPGLSINPTTGEVTGTYLADASVAGPYTVVITATDDLGESTTQQFVWAVINPMPIAESDSDLTDQDTLVAFNVLTDNNGSGIDSDPDGDALRVSDVNGNSNAVGQPIAGTNGGSFTIQSDGSLQFDPNGEFDDLLPGQSRVTQVDYTITDDEGGVDSTTVTIIVSGLEDSPEVVFSLPDQVDIEGEPIDPVSIADGFDDPDAGDSLTFGDGGTLPSGLTLDPVTGQITGTPDIGTAEIGTFPITITATDTTGRSTSQTFTWTISGTDTFEFAFDSFNDFSDEGKELRYGDYIHHRDVVLSEQIDRLAPEPILAGYAAPGSVLIGRIYDSSGSIIGETNLTVGPSGNWTMHFFGTKTTTHARVVIEHVATENVALGNTALKLTDDTYRAMQLDAASKPSPTAGSILDGTASKTLETHAGQNLNPLGLL